SGLSVLHAENFGAPVNPMGYRDGIDQPPVEGSGVDPLPGQGRPIKAGEFILGYPGESGVPLPMPQPDILSRASAPSIDSFGPTEAPRKNVSWSPQSSSAVGAAALR